MNAISPSSSNDEAATSIEGMRPELLIAVVILIGAGIYIGFYWRGASSADRNARAFTLERCPICEIGSLTPETSQTRFLGIPRTRTTVRCDHCRSVLRQVGENQWRYAVDPAVNPALYAQLNGHLLDNAAVRALSTKYRASARGRMQSTPPPMTGTDASAAPPDEA